MSIGKLHEIKFSGREDLQIFGKTVQVDECHDDDGQCLDRSVWLPHSISCVLDYAIEAKQFGQPLAILSYARSIDAATTCRTAIDASIKCLKSLQIPE